MLAQRGSRIAWTGLRVNGVETRAEVLRQVQGGTNAMSREETDGGWSEILTALAIMGIIAFLLWI